jgi:ribosomal protein S19
VGLVFQIHNGKNYIDVAITEDMVGHKLGEFSPYTFPSYNWIESLILTGI